MLRFVLSITATLALAASTEVYATWSIAAVNPKTGTLAVAGASCSYMVYGIANVVPGKGIVIVQAASNDQARSDATALLETDKPLDQIMAKLTDPDSGYDQEEQQYALLSIDKDVEPLTYTGSAVEDAKGSMSAANYTVQANTMVSDDVVKQTFTALDGGHWQDDKAMAKSLMKAMQAGAAIGGDKRCIGTGSASAFISLFHKDDNPRQPWVNLVVFGIEPGNRSALERLKVTFDHWLVSGTADPSTQMFLIPSKVTKKP